MTKEYQELNEIDLKILLSGPVIDLVLLRITEDLTLFTRNISSKKDVFESIRVAMAVMKMLCDINENREALTRMYNRLYSTAANFGGDKDTIKQANALKAAVEIVDSNSENWKQAMIAKLINTCDTFQLRKNKVRKGLQNEKEQGHTKTKRSLYKDVHCLNNSSSEDPSSDQEHARINVNHYNC
jgi:hypothetical protein